MTKGKVLSGTVIRVSSMQTLVVEVSRTWKHPIYKKALRRHRRFLVHYTGEAPAIGAKVMISETKPISKNKHFILK